MSDKQGEVDALTEALVTEVRHWLARDLPVPAMRALRRPELDALRLRVSRVLRGETPYGEERVIRETGRGEDE